MERSEYFVSLWMNVITEYSVTVNSEELTGATEYLTYGRSVAETDVMTGFGL
jgi:hypothetical protein